MDAKISVLVLVGNGLSDFRVFAFTSPASAVSLLASPRCQHNCLKNSRQYSAVLKDKSGKLCDTKGQGPVKSRNPLVMHRRLQDQRSAIALGGHHHKAE